MTLWAIVPVKPLRRGKSRLSGVLTEEERTILNYTLLGHTLKTLGEVKRIDTILVVSRDPAALALAREHGARTVLEEGSPELNTALRRAATVANVYHAQEILIIPADLPLITADDVQQFLSHVKKPPQMIIAPDRRMDGTNALYISPPEMIEFNYGPGSYHKYRQQAEKLDIPVEVCEMSSFGLDLDLPEDL